MQRSKSAPDTDSTVERAPDRTQEASAPAPWPRLPKVYLPRHSLWADLDRSADAAITLLIAPAGAGKTLGVAGWLRQQNDDGPPRPQRWVDADDNLGPDQLSSLLDETAHGVPPRIVIDDAHLLPAATHRMLNDRLNDDPDSMRLVLISRWDLPFTRLVPELLGNFSIVRGNVLHLSDTEAETLIIEHSRTRSRQVIDGITRQARGWCAAVVLAARSVHASPPGWADEAAFEEGTIGLGDRVASEVFASLSSRARHLLLCTSAESIVTARTAAHLTQDPSAGETLADLESTGLLVTRAVPLVTHAEAEDAYRIHPLLAEVVRRRLVAGGVDVVRARSTVVRAVRIDRTRGETLSALRRLEAVGAYEEMTVVLAEDGVRMVMRGDGERLNPFARNLLEHVETTPRTWFALAIEHWLDGEVPESEHWLDKCLAEPAAMSAEELACIGLMRARLGLESMRAAADTAAEVARRSHHAGRESSILPQLLIELGITQGWLGELSAAEQSLTAAIGLARSWGMPAVGAEASSHLAMTEYMLGREAACGEIADEAGALLDRAARARSRCPRQEFTRTRTALASSLASTARHPWREIECIAEATLHPADLCSRFWMRLREAHITMSGHSVVRARQMLDEPLDLPGAFPLPDHLQVALLVNQAELAALATDRRSLKAAESALTERGMTGEAALAKALHADLDGNRRLAADHFETAAQQARWGQPMVRAVALVARAELLHEMGDVDAAFDHLQQAAIETEVRQNAIPFFGWTRQGTPVQTMLGRFPSLTSQPWGGRIASGFEGMPSLATYFDQGTPRPSETVDEAAGPIPGLSARERDVLRELARGSTYADISAALFVSENTVKTHVSSLYAKLGASRRSQALAVARSLSLI
ncbi:LuxR C-terminal-related transcriptional regulator [Nocardioides sp. CCNWLW239]|uniref:LuxR C-terminal-related transcriptional regulator n=1 Tax=Nocardioides sp. CCNWLW239 TaxID=3128902 RepID=UPI00301B4E00